MVANKQKVSYAHLNAHGRKLFVAGVVLIVLGALSLVAMFSGGATEGQMAECFFVGAICLAAGILLKNSAKNYLKTAEQIKQDEKAKRRAQEEKRRWAQTPASKKRAQCPYCHGTNIEPIGRNRKGFSVGKAVGGALLLGGNGMIAGFAGKDTNKYDFYCHDCGKIFRRKR